MRTFHIQGSSGGSTIRVGERLRNTIKWLPSEKGVIITDANVKRLYEKDFPPLEAIEIGTGERIKTLDTVETLYESLTNLEADRSTFILGIGGGIVCDVTGFVASTYLRGVRFGFVASTLLAQVDAAVGGKNGVNFRGYKNMVGTFNQPDFVICDPYLLRTLPERELHQGFAEIVKHGAMGDADLFAFLEEKSEQAKALDPDAIEKIVYDSVVLKAGIVNRDEKEKGERRKLNFGHTFGHAIEKVTGLPHGEAVGLGMLVAASLSQRRGYLSVEERERIRALIIQLGLPHRLQGDGEKIVHALRKDKKREGEEIYFVLLQQIGNAIVEKVSLDELEAVVNDLW
jgi:3-dehydroquinate synthase